VRLDGPVRGVVVLREMGLLARLARIVDINDQVEAYRRVFESDTRWTVVRGSDLEQGESQGLPVWSRHLGDGLECHGSCKGGLRSAGTHRATHRPRLIREWLASLHAVAGTHAPWLRAYLPRVGATQCTKRDLPNCAGRFHLRRKLYLAKYSGVAT
jgi:hypothetical protein